MKINLKTICLFCVVWFPISILSDDDVVNILSKQTNRFGLNLLDEIAKNRENQGQIFLSPYSIAMALAMVYAGSGGNSQQQLQQIIGYDECIDIRRNSCQVIDTIEQMNQRLSQIINNDMAIEIGNLMLMAENFEIIPEYFMAIQNHFNGEIIRENLAENGVEAMNKINKFISNRTHGMIDQFLTMPLGPADRFSLFNAIYFKGNWESPFEKSQTHEDIFYGQNDRQRRVQFMRKEEYLSHHALDNLDADMILLEYKGYKVIFVGILPRKRDADLAKLHKALNMTEIQEKIHKKGGGYCVVHLPKMEFDTTYDSLQKEIQTMGIEDIFEVGKANFTGITINEQFAIGKMLHKAKIKIDEEGTVAAAAFGFIMVTSSGISEEPVPEFRFDHPFLFFIHHKPTGQHLFMGEIRYL